MDQVTTAEAAATLGLSVRTVHRLIAGGALAATKLPTRTGTYLITREELDRYARQRTAAKAPAA